MMATWLIAASVALAAASTLTAQPVRDASFVVHELESVNSTYDDYAPYLHPDGLRLFLTSSRSGSADLYVSTRDQSLWRAPIDVQLPGVNSDVDDGALSGPFPPIAQLYPIDARLSRELNHPQTALLTSGRRSDGEGDADIYLVPMSEDSTHNPSPLREVNTDGWESQPSMAPDGSFIIFTSIRSEGEGGMDLYMSLRQPDGSYGAVQSLGSPVNTDLNELAPHIAADGRTLFFSSDGHRGFGGADFFRTRMRDDGTWAPPVNLGDAINTSANEVFFYGAGRERCLFASDRDGGAGGLDIYEGTPNIFAPGYATVRWRMRDTTARRGVGGYIRIVETSRGGTVFKASVDSERGVDVPMLAGFTYRVEVSPSGFADTSFVVDDLEAERTIDKELVFASVTPPRPVAHEFSLEGLDVPLFVSGYYRLNTIALLEDLRTRQASGDLRGKTYIADVSRDRGAYDEYRVMAERVGRIVDAFIERALRLDFPAFNKGRAENERLEIVVYGYADPRPVLGTYNEATVAFVDQRGAKHTVSTGDSLSNLHLAGLRAHYAKAYIDARFRAGASNGHREYIDLLERGLINWKIVSAEVDDITRSNDLAEKRRIRVEFRRVKD